MQLKDIDPNVAEEWMQDVQHQFTDLNTRLAESEAALATKNVEIQELHNLYKRGPRTQTRMAPSEENTEGLRGELDALRRKYNDVVSLSDTRGKELAGTQTFLSRADGISVEEAVDKVTALNEEIFQASAFLAECMVQKRYNFTDAEWRDFSDEAGRYLNEQVMTLLYQETKREGQPEYLLVQVIIQILLVDACKAEIHSWYPDDREVSRVLKEVHGRILASEQPAVSGRWRALTLAHIPPRPENWIVHFFSYLMTILKCANWDTERPEQLEAFGRRVEQVLKVAHDVRRAIKEKITSADYEIYTADAKNGPFIEAYMEDAYEDDRHGGYHHEIGSVLGTMAMGLAQTIQVNGDGTNVPAPPVLRPKVVLETTFRAALYPDSSPPPRYGDGFG